MNNDFHIIHHELEEDHISVMPIADVHLGAIESNIVKFSETIDYIKSDPDRYIVLIGDLIDNATRNSIADPYNHTMPPAKQKERMIEMLDPIKDRILGMTSGNHENRTRRESDQDISYDIAKALGIGDLYRPHGAFIDISLDGDKTMMMIHHGAGGARKTGGVVNRVEDFIKDYDFVDIFVRAHTHNPFVTKPCKNIINPETGMVERRTVVCATTCSWLEYGGYAFGGEYSPRTTCNPMEFYIYDTGEIIVDW